MMKYEIKDKTQSNRPALCSDGGCEVVKRQVLMMTDKTRSVFTLVAFCSKHEH